LVGLAFPVVRTVNVHQTKTQFPADLLAPLAIEELDAIDEAAFLI
jgi:hypothetical protein